MNCGFVEEVRSKKYYIILHSGVLLYADKIGRFREFLIAMTKKVQLAID
jgi:hypothetical protein